MAPLANYRRWTPAQTAALAFGIWWIGNGVAVFASEPSGATLATDSAVRAFGLSIAVNGWHGIFHFSTGLAGVAVCRWPRASRAYVLLMAGLYLSAALWSLFAGATVFGVIHVDDLGSADHAVEGAAMAAIWLTSRRAVRRVTPHRVVGPQDARSFDRRVAGQDALRVPPDTSLRS